MCHVITGFDTGGAERVLLRTVQRLDENRFRSFIVSLRPPGPLSPEAERSGVEVIHLGMGRHPGPETVRRLARLFRDRKVDIAHSYLYYASIATRLAGQWANVPVVLTSTRAPLGYLPRPAWWIDRITAQWCQRIIAVSKHTADFIVRVERIARDKVVIILNGVDLQRFKPRDARIARAHLGISDGVFVVASVGRLSQEKGHRYLLEALAAVRDAVPSIVCLLAGDGPLRQSLETQVSLLGLGDVCRFLGEVPQIETVFAAADVLALPSLFEGMPNAVLEAMAMGCPVIATEVGGSVELVVAGVTGLLVAPADASALARALLELAGDSQRRESMGIAARAVAERSYGIDRMIDSVEALYMTEWATVMRRSGSR